MYLIFLHFRIPLLQFTSLVTLQPLFLQILDFLLTSNSPHFTSLITFLTRFLKNLGLVRNLTVCPYLCCTGQPWTRDLWVDVANSVPPPTCNPQIHLVLYSINRRVRGPHCLPRPPTARQSWHCSTTPVSPVLHWSSCPRITGTFISLTQRGTLREFHLHGGQAPGLWLVGEINSNSV